jgi:hypothetical protein
MCDFRKPAVAASRYASFVEVPSEADDGVIAGIRMPRYRSESENIGVVMNFTS